MPTRVRAAAPRRRAPNRSSAEPRRLVCAGSPVPPVPATALYGGSPTASGPVLPLGTPPRLAGGAPGQTPPTTNGGWPSKDATPRSSTAVPAAGSSSAPDEMAGQLQNLGGVLRGDGDTAWLLNQLFQHDGLQDKHPEVLQQKIEEKQQKLDELATATSTMKVKIEKSAERDKRLMGRLVGTINRFSHVHVASAMDAWRQAVGERKRQRNVVGNIVAKLRNQTLSSALNGWLESIDENKRRRAVLHRCIVRMGQRILATALQSWFASWKEAKNQRLIVQRCLAKMLQGTMAAAWSGWREMVETKKRHAQVVRLAAPLLLLLLLRPAVFTALTECDSRCRRWRGACVGCSPRRSRRHSAAGLRS